MRDFYNCWRIYLDQDIKVYFEATLSWCKLVMQLKLIKLIARAVVIESLDLL